MGVVHYERALVIFFSPFVSFHSFEYVCVRSSYSLFIDFSLISLRVVSGGSWVHLANLVIVAATVRRFTCLVVYIHSDRKKDSDQTQFLLHSGLGRTRSSRH